MDKQKEKDDKGEQIQQQISKITKAIAIQSNNTNNSVNLLAMLTQFSPLLTDLKDFSGQLQYQDTMLIYQKYHKYIKQLENANEQVTALSRMSAGAKEGSAKFEEIKNRVIKMMEKLSNLQKEALDTNKMVLLWVDKNRGNNDKEMKEFQQDYNGKIDIEYFDDYAKFQQDIFNHKKSPLIIIMSAAAAGSNEDYKDGFIFDFLKANKQHFRIKGSVIYCGSAGYANLKHLKVDDSKLLSEITTDYTQFVNAVKELIIPVRFNRMVPLEFLDLYIPNQKTKFITKNQKDWSGTNLTSFSSNNFTKLFQEAYDYTEKQKIKFDPPVIKSMLTIPAVLQSIFQNFKNEEELCDQIVRAYSKEDGTSPIYKLLNSVLNILNEQLLLIMEPFIDLYFTALFKYDDKADTLIKPDGNQFTLYRGSSIPADQFEDYIQVEKFVVLPSFSSFSSEEKEAKKFLTMNQLNNDTPVLFEYKYSSGSKQFNSRPKAIIRVSNFQYEKEYLVYPFTVFRIQKITLPNGSDNFTRITLIM